MVLSVSIIMKMSGLGKLAWVLLLIGGLNWGLVGLFNYNLVSMIFGYGMVANIIYDLVGLSAVYAIFKGMM